MAAPRTTTGTLVLVDAGMLAGFRRSKPSLGQLHQALVHLHRPSPDVPAAVPADPSLKRDLAAGEQNTSDGDIIAAAVVFAPDGAPERSEERLVGEEGGQQCQSRWSP